MELSHFGTGIYANYRRYQCLIPTLLSIVINKSLKKQCGHRDQQNELTKFDAYPITDITVLIYIDCLSLYTIIYQVHIELTLLLT